MWKKLGDHIISLKFVVEQYTFNVISAYTPHVGCLQHLKVKFWEDLEALFQDIPKGEKIFLGENLKWYVGSVAKEFKGVHEGKISGK